MSHDEYLTHVAGRLRAAGAQVTTEDFQGIPAVIGYRSQFRLRWMATKLHLFTIVLPVDVVHQSDLERFAKDALDFASSKKGTFRGLQSGIAAIPVLVGSTVDPEAATYAQSKIVKRFSAFAWPAAVDLSTGEVHTHQGRVAIGGIYASWMREQTALALKDPARA